MEKKGNTKIIWYILFAFITIIMCYLFSVVFFFFISPYDISLKTNLWPFLSDAQIGEFYSEAIVDIKFTAQNDEYFGEVEVSAVGVNVRKDGYILSTSNAFENATEESKIQIYAKSGKIYDGKILYLDKNNNLAIIKCESEEKLKMPFVKIGNVATENSVNTEIIAINSENRKVATGKVTDYDVVDAFTSVSEGIHKVDHVAEYCLCAEISANFESGVVFDKKGTLLGFSVAQNGTQFSVMPVEACKFYLNSTVESYENKTNYSNKLVGAFVGFDNYEVNYFMELSEKNSDKTKFYFNNKTQEYTDNIKFFAGPNQTGYFLFEDLIYDEKIVLTAQNVITSVYFDKISYEIECRADLINALYNVEEGQSLTIYYHKIDALGTELTSVTFNV